MKLRKMERKVLLVAFALSLALSVIGCGDSRDTSNNNPNPNTFTPKGTVSGLLRDAVTNVALVGAKVQIMDRVATTDSSGMFTITNVPALTGDGHNEPYIENSAYPVVIDMAAINAGITAYNAIATNTVKKAFYPSMAYAEVYVYYTSLGESSDLGYGGGYGGAAANATNHDTPVDGFVANMTPFVGKLDANVKMQVVNSSLVPQVGATVYLFSALGTSQVQPDTSTGTTGGSSTAAVDGGAPGHLVATQTTIADGYVTFTNIEAKRSFYVKAVIGANQGWWVGVPSTGQPFAVPASGGPSALIAPADNLIDIYGLNQSGFVSTSPELLIGTYFSAPLVVRTVDGLAPFILSVVPANLSDFAIPATGTVDTVFTFSEALRSTTYANNLTRETSVNGGLYTDVAVNYLGPKAGNIPHTLAWNEGRTTLTVSIPVASMTPASRYEISILKACDGAGTLGTAGRLTDANGNNFIAFTSNFVTKFTTAGGFNVAAPVIVKDLTSAYTVNWTPVTNAFGYKVYVEAVAGTGFFVVKKRTGVAFTSLADVYNNVNAADNVVGTPTTFSLTLLDTTATPAANSLCVIGKRADGTFYNVMENLFAGGKSYNVYIVALSSNRSESPQSNIVAVSETKPAAPAGLARRGTTYLIDWTAVAGATQYTIWVQTLQNGAALAGYVPLVATSIDPTYDLATVPNTGTMGQPGFVPATLPFAGTGAGVNGYPLGAKLSYNVAVSTTSPTNSLTSDLSTPVLIDDKTALALAQPAFGAIVMDAGTSLPTAIPPGIVGGAATTAVRNAAGAGAWSGVSVNQAAAFTMTATITVPEQLTYSSAIAAANWTVAIISAGGFAAGKAAIVAPVTAVIDTMPTISNIAYNRLAGGGNVTFTLTYAAPGTNVQAWYGAANTVLLQTAVTDLNGNVVTNRANGAGNAAGVIIN